ncbi:hypothetical protein [Polymorphum gilvum]|uniref:Uncharacterized protein n=1 Tax=Polymorphum gilvum (strain LMG 25793 / CGMCC 1.9160 / SL003B-26A1) TaxID=991905 RepID=F2J5N8_POLGS|nr:hypothetical protein [Polymorphum gilvum]ADZ70122.1 hypothetical protein SL003B_1694 [Polymorphum gilvum SL003B-26A1]
MPEPFEIIAAPFTAWYAPLGEDFPEINAAVAGNWVKIGANGDESMNEDGVTIQHSQEVNKIRPLGSTVPIKAFRTAEDLLISFTLWDVTEEAYRLAVNSNAVTTVAAGSGTPGKKTLQFYQGEQVATMALLLRAEVSPYGDGMNMQYEVPYCFMSGNPEPVFAKGEPAGLAFEFTALRDPDAGSKAASFGRLVTQHQLPLA